MSTFSPVQTMDTHLSATANQATQEPIVWSTLMNAHLILVRTAGLAMTSSMDFNVNVLQASLEKLVKVHF